MKLSSSKGALQSASNFDPLKAGLTLRTPAAGDVDPNISQAYLPATLTSDHLWPAASLCLGRPGRRWVLGDGAGPPTPRSLFAEMGPPRRGPGSAM
jgi:hypothetical protein